MKDREKNYPGTDTPVTAPFYIFECANGHKHFSVLPRSDVCPECGCKDVKLIRDKDYMKK